MRWKAQHENQRIESVSRFFCESAKLLDLLVDLIGIEPMTSSMPWKRAPSCATGPRLEVCNSPIVSAEARFVNLAWASSGWRAFCIDRREFRVLAVDWGWQNRRQCEAEVAICRLP